MCLNILRNPTKAIMDAKKRNSGKKALVVLIENSVIFAIAAGLLVAKTGFPLLVGSVITGFLMALIGMVLLGLVLHITTTTLGGKGKHHEGLTAVAYAFTPFSVGLLVISLLAWIPFTIGVQIVVLALAFALGISVLYRGIKELYRTDMLTSFVSISIAILAILISIYLSAGLALMSRLAAGVL